MVNGGTETHWGIGVTLGPSDEGAEYRDDVVRNPLVALARGVQRTGEILVMIVGGIAQLVTGHVGMSSLSGPIGIGEIAADAYQASWEQFVWLMAVISVNLAILNLLPIPVLDGGQIVLAAAEGIKGSPLPARARDVAQTVGLSLILLLMGVAFWNDIARHWSGVRAVLLDAGLSGRAARARDVRRARLARALRGRATARRGARSTRASATPRRCSSASIACSRACGRALDDGRSDRARDRAGLVHRTAHRARDRARARVRHRSPARARCPRSRRSRPRPPSVGLIAPILDARAVGGLRGSVPRGRQRARRRFVRLDRGVPRAPAARRADRASGQRRLAAPRGDRGATRRARASSCRPNPAACARASVGRLGPATRGRGRERGPGARGAALSAPRRGRSKALGFTPRQRTHTLAKPPGRR